MANQLENSRENLSITQKITSLGSGHPVRLAWENVIQGTLDDPKMERSKEAREALTAFNEAFKAHFGREMDTEELIALYAAHDEVRVESPDSSTASDLIQLLRAKVTAQLSSNE